jgi:hypothetical protein
MESLIQFAFATIAYSEKFTQLQQILAFCNVLTKSLSCQRSSNSLNIHPGIGNERCAPGRSLPSMGAGAIGEMQNIVSLILLIQANQKCGLYNH